MKEESIIVHPFEELKIERYQGLQQINEHAYAKLYGQIPFAKIDEYMQVGQNQVWVQVTAVSQDKTQILFYGIINNMKLEVKGGTCGIELILRSGTALMDCQKRIRSFQSENLTYDKLLDTCKRTPDTTARIMTVGKGVNIQQFIMQYQETDWNFIKRLASMNHTVVVADCSTQGEKYYFGLPDRKDTIEGDSIEYNICYDMEEYWQKKKNGIDAAPIDTMSYIWTSREIHELGDCGIIDGRRLFIWKIMTEMRGSVLYHTYYMRLKQGFQVSALCNPSISGVSLFGIIRNVSEEKVQIEMIDDENKEQIEMRWFPFSTVYSAEDGTGWYSMPEIGDKARLYFPTEKESEAYVVSAYHEEGAQLRKNPECKFWRNREGKEIQLAPGKILLTNNNGTYIELSDEGGISIVSRGSVTLSANGMMNISSEDLIELSAVNKVVIKQGGTEMNLGGDLNMSGARVKL